MLRINDTPSPIFSTAKCVGYPCLGLPLGQLRAPTKLNSIDFRSTPIYDQNMKISFDLPESTFATFRQTPAEFMEELRLAATIKWYEMGRLSQAKAAELAGLTRHGFIEALFRYQVPAIQYTPEDLEKELLV